MTAPHRDRLVKSLLGILPAIAVILGCGMMISAYMETAAVEASALPLVMTPGEDKPALTVALDAGHGGEDGGAVGAAGTVEAGLNLAYAKALGAELEARGYTVVMTRGTEEALAHSKKEDLQKRRELINGCNADIAVSVHMNKFGDSSVSGPMAFYMKGSAEGEALAKCVIDSVCDAIGRPRRIANPGDYFVIRESDMPAVLIECGFLSNAADEALLKTREHMDALVSGIADGIDAYFGK